MIKIKTIQIRRLVKAFIASPLLPFAPALLGGGSHLPDEPEWADHLALHASFDETLMADFSRGDRALYSFSNPAERDAGGITVKADPPMLRIVPEGGKFGGCLRREKGDTRRLFYRAGSVLRFEEYIPVSGTVSVWIRTSPDEDLSDQYCDPVMFMDRDFHDGSIFIEWSKDHAPRRFRFAMLPKTETWNPDRIGWEDHPPGARPVVELTSSIFSRESWVHVAFTFENYNSASGGKGALYINGLHQGVINTRDFTSAWSPETLMLLVGVHFAGDLDDLAVFDIPLKPQEIAVLYRLPGGIQDLRDISASRR